MRIYVLIDGAFTNRKIITVSDSLERVVNVAKQQKSTDDLKIEIHNDKNDESYVSTILIETAEKLIELDKRERKPDNNFNFEDLLKDAE
jgi:hypothetical protein